MGFLGRKYVRAVVLGLVLGGALVAWERHQRVALGDIPHPAKEPPHGESAPARLAGHVVTLAKTIGERNFYEAKALGEASAYIEGQFKKQGWTVTVQTYPVVLDASRRVEGRNLEVVLPSAAKDAPVLVVGAHYDSAPGTPGADDNASGVAALLELASRFKGRTLPVELRFVAFGTEEPPFFGTEQMGSAHYARKLAKEGRSVAGMLSLETIGYFSDEPRSQVYPPPLSLFYPDRGNYIGIVGNLPSRAFMKRLRDGWKAPRGLPVIGTALPEFIKEITYSDQLWFWGRGWPAVMVSDTAFLRDPNYHKGSDLPDQLDYDRLADAVDGLEAALSAVTR